MLRSPASKCARYRAASANSAHVSAGIGALSIVNPFNAQFEIKSFALFPSGESEFLQSAKKIFGKNFRADVSHPGQGANSCLERLRTRDRLETDRENGSRSRPVRKGLQCFAGASSQINGFDFRRRQRAVVHADFINQTFVILRCRTGGMK